MHNHVTTQTLVHLNAQPMNMPERDSQYHHSRSNALYMQVCENVHFIIMIYHLKTILFSAVDESGSTECREHHKTKQRWVKKDVLREDECTCLTNH